MGLKNVLKKIERVIENESMVDVCNGLALSADIVRKEIAKKKHKSKPDFSQYEIVDGSCCECELKRECDENEKHIAEWCSTCLGEIYRKKQTSEDWIGRQVIFHLPNINKYVIGTLNDITQAYYFINRERYIKKGEIMPLKEWYKQQGGE